MPDPNIGQLTASTFERVVRRKPEDNVFLSQLLLYLLKEGGGFSKEPGGALIEETLMYAENTTFGSHSGYDTLNVTPVDVFDAARFNWKENAGTISYSQIEQDRCMGEEAKFALVDEKVENGKQSHFATINRQMYSDGTGNGGKDIGGLALLVSSTPTVGSPGGINRATFPFWRNRQVLGTKTTAAFDNLRGAMRSIYNSCSKGAADQHPKWYVFDQASFEGYESTLVANERFTDKSSADGGFLNETIKFKACKVTFDEDCPAGTGFCLNPKFLKYRYLRWAKAEPAIRPANQTAEVVQIYGSGNLSMSNPRRLGVITVIT